VLETDDVQLKQKAHYNLGNAEFRRGNPKEAVSHYEAALAIDPDDRLTKENLKFVKKVMEQQKQSGDGQKDGDPKKQDPEKQSKSDGAQDPQSADEQQQQEGSRDDPSAGRGEQQRTEFGDEMDEQQDRQANPADPAQDGEQPAETPQAGRSGDQTGDPGQAERMLNRLQDQPGRALMPATGKRTVEKDW
jgi:Ca-activated chloride channel family protein